MTTGQRQGRILAVERDTGRFVVQLPGRPAFVLSDRSQSYATGSLTSSALPPGVEESVSIHPQNVVRVVRAGRPQRLDPRVWTVSQVKQKRGGGGGGEIIERPGPCRR